MRIALLLVTLLFLGALIALTVSDIVHNGINGLDVLSVAIIGLFGVAIVGSLVSRPPQEEPDDV